MFTFSAWEGKYYFGVNLIQKIKIIYLIFQIWFLDEFIEFSVLFTISVVDCEWPFDVNFA